MKAASEEGPRKVRVSLVVEDVDQYIASMRRARHEMKRFAKATKNARKQQRKLLEEGDI